MRKNINSRFLLATALLLVLLTNTFTQSGTSDNSELIAKRHKIENELRDIAVIDAK